MDVLEQMRINLNNNKELTKDFKFKIFEFILLFNKKFPNVSLEKICSRISTVTFERVSSFERRGTFIYDAKLNRVMYDARKIKEEDYDIDNLLMKAIVTLISSTDTYYGFDKEGNLSALNKAVTEMIASHIVGNEGTSDYEEEIIIANLISKIIGVDLLIESYFKNDSETILKSLVEVDVYDMVVEMIKDMNYACDLKESSGMISNKYKKIFESLIKKALKAYEKGMMDAQKLKEFREILPQRSEMFSKEHTVDYSTLTKEVDMTLNDIQVQNLIDEEYVPRIKAA